MKTRLTLFLALTLPLAAQIKITGTDPAAIEVNGKPFAEFHKGTDVFKPFMAPLRSASGKMVTRHFPMEKVAGESRDHPHHRGLWFSYDDVNGVKFWENDPTYTKPNIGKIVVRELTSKDGAESGTLTMVADWNDPQGKTLLVENRVMTFYADKDLRTVDFDITLNAKQAVTLGDTKEGAFAIRLADSMAEKNGGKMVNAEGKAGMKEVWGNKSKWVDYSGDVEGEKVGIAILDHPENPRAPTYWHARDYGLFALNPFGQQAFDKTQPESHWSVEAGKSLRFRWRVVIHPGDTEAAKVGALYEKFAAK